MAGLATVSRPMGRPNCTANLLDTYGRAAYTCTTDANGLATWSGVAPGTYRTQISYVVPEGKGATKTITVTEPPTGVPIVVADINQQYEPLVQAPNGTIWRISVSNTGVISATQLS